MVKPLADNHTTTQERPPHKRRSDRAASRSNGNIRGFIVDLCYLAGLAIVVLIILGLA